MAVSRPERPVNTDPVWIAACQQSRPRGRADWLGDMKVGEADALAGEPIDVRCRGEAAAVAGRIGIAHVVSEDDHDVGALLPNGLLGWFGDPQLRLARWFGLGGRLGRFRLLLLLTFCRWVELSIKAGEPQVFRCNCLPGLFQLPHPLRLCCREILPFRPIA